jgi:hypothetical protein
MIRSLFITLLPVVVGEQTEPRRPLASEPGRGRHASQRQTGRFDVEPGRRRHDYQHEAVKTAREP